MIDHHQHIYIYIHVCVYRYIYIYITNYCNITMEHHHFSWENSLFLWPFAIAMFNHQRVNTHYRFHSIQLSMGRSTITIFTWRLFSSLSVNIYQRKHHLELPSGNFTYLLHMAMRIVRFPIENPYFP